MGEMRFVLDSDSWKTDTPKGSLTKAFKATERPPVAFYYDSNRKPRIRNQIIPRFSCMGKSTHAITLCRFSLEALIFCIK